MYTRTAFKNSKQLTQLTQRFLGTKFEKFNWEDPLYLHGKLTEEEQMINEVARTLPQTSSCPESKTPTTRSTFNWK